MVNKVLCVFLHNMVTLHIIFKCEKIDHIAKYSMLCSVYLLLLTAVDFARSGEYVDFEPSKLAVLLEELDDFGTQ